MVFRSGVFLVLVFVLLVSGCGPGAPTPPPTPVSPPVSVSSPVGGKRPAPAVSRQVMYAEAVKAFWGFIETQRSYELTGDYSQFPPDMANYLDTDMLERTRALFEEGKADGWHLTAPAQITIEPNWSRRLGDSVATMAVCQDATGVVVLDGEGNEVGVGTLSSFYAYFRVADDGLVKLFQTDARDKELCK